MISYKELLKNKFVFSLIIVLILLVILSIIFPISLFQNLTTQLSIITALIIPFIMKGIEREEKERDEQDIIIQIINRIKDYLKYIMNTEKRGQYYRFSGSMSFIHFISQKFPEILIKIGIEINQKEEEEPSLIEGKIIYRSSELYILDKYLIGLDPICKLISIDQNKEITPNKKEFERIMRELIEHANRVFPFKLSKDLAKF